MVLLHILPKRHFELDINEHGDVFMGSRHLGELVVYNEYNTTLVGPTGPTGHITCGNQGPRGITGDTGIIGTMGTSLTGSIGPTGIDGLPGLLGPVGLKGRCGPYGSIGITGDVGPPRCVNPNPFLSAIVENQFLYNNYTYPILPWSTIINNEFILANNIITFPKKYAIYKIELCIQLRNCELNVLTIELLFNGKCKKAIYLTPQSKHPIHTFSPCSSLHIIYPVEQETQMEIRINCMNSIVNFENMYLTIIEVV